MAYCGISENVSLYYEECGSGENYLICTQIGHGPYSLERELAKRGFHVFLLTNRGFGRSTHIFGKIEENWYDMWADDVVRFADKMGIRTFSYSGASHGAGTGWHLVLRVKCFFAVVPGPHSLDEGTMSYRNMIELGLVEPKPMTMPTEDERLIERRRLRDLYRDPELEELQAAPEVKAVEYGRPLSYYGNEENLKKALRTIETPVLIMGGTEDVISRPDLMIRSAECLKNCKTVIYSGFGHDLDIYEELVDESRDIADHVISDMPFDAVISGCFQDIAIYCRHEKMIQIRIQPEICIFPIRQLFLKLLIVVIREYLEILFSLHYKHRLLIFHKVVRSRFPPHFLKVIKCQISGEFLLSGFFIAHFIKSVELFGKDPVFQPGDPFQDRTAAAGLLQLPEHDIFQSVRRSGHQDEAFDVSAFRVDPGCQHGAHAVPENIDPVMIDPGVFFQDLYSQQGIVDGFFFNRGAGPCKLSRVYKGSFIISQRSDPVTGKAFRQILEGREFHDLFVHIAGTGAVDHDHRRYRF